jgi:hypothetical protein
MVLIASLAGLEVSHLDSTERLGNCLAELGLRVFGDLLVVVVAVGSLPEADGSV